jgi:branched-chain amino acid transport system ATP-binding protein
MAGETMLEVSGVSRHFGGVRALTDMNLRVGKGEIVGLIGPNGAGKSTLFNVVSGVHSATSGSVLFDGQEITNLKPHVIARRGLVRSFQANVLFRERSVLWNVMLGCQLPAKFSLVGSMFNVTGTRRRETWARAKALDVIRFVGLENLTTLQASTLSYGHQRMLGVAIALAAEPKLLFLDEPASGMDADQLKAMLDLIQRVRDSGITIVLIEHNMRAIFKLCDRITVMAAGTKLADGTPEEVRTNPAVISAYLGGGAVSA